MRAALLDVAHQWRCPECSREHVTRETLPHTPMHQCPRLRGAWAPFVPAGTKAKLTVNTWEDYVGGELVQTDGEGRPIMSITTTRDEGQDCHIFAPTAQAVYEG